MENSILTSLKDLGYEGPLLDGDAFAMALCGGPKSLEYTKLVHTLTEELGNLSNLEERVNFISDPNDCTNFLLELSSFLKELGCPYKSLTTGYMSSRLQTKNDRILLLDYLISELMAVKLLKMTCLEDKPPPDEAIDLEESPTAKDLKDILIMLKINKPPVMLTSNMLFLKLEARLKETMQKKGRQLVGEPLYVPNANQTLTEEGSRQLEDTFKEMLADYTLRREALITRLDCTVKSFEWSDRHQHKAQAIRAVYLPKRHELKAEPDVKLMDFLAARTWLLDVERSSSTIVKKYIYSDVKKIIIGQMPDRGGRPNDHLPPDVWRRRSEPQGNCSGPGSSISDSRGGARNQIQEKHASPQASQTVASQYENHLQIQEYPQYGYKQEPYGCDEDQVGFSENHTFCSQNLDGNGYIQGYSLNNSNEGGFINDKRTELACIKTEKDLSTNLDLLTLEINIGDTSNLSILDLNNSVSMNSSQERNGAFVNDTYVDYKNNCNAQKMTSIEGQNNSSTEDVWSNWEPDNLPKYSWSDVGPKIIRLGITNHEFSFLTVRHDMYVVNGSACKRLFRFLTRHVEFDDALEMCRRTSKNAMNLTVNNRPFKCTASEVSQMYLKNPADEFVYKNPLLESDPDDVYVPLPQRKKINQVDEIVYDKSSFVPVKRSLSDDESLDEPPNKIPKIEPGSNTVCDVEICDVAPMTKERSQTVRFAILRAIVMMEKLTRPKIFKWEYKTECLSVRCGNEDSRKWLGEFISGLKPWPEAQLFVKDIHVHEIEDEEPMVIRYIYTADYLYFIDITKTTEYSGVFTNSDEGAADNFTKCVIWKKRPRRTYPNCKLRIMQRNRQGKRAAELAAAKIKCENDTKCFEAVSVKEEPHDDMGETDAYVAMFMHNQQFQVKTEQEIKAELMDADENDFTYPSYSPTINMNDGRQVGLPAVGHSQSSQVQMFSANASSSSEIPICNIPVKRRKYRRRKKSSFNVSGGNNAVTDQSNKQRVQENRNPHLN